MSNITAAITAVGGYVPEYVLSNKVLETMVDTNDEWITTRTGIKERRLLKEEGKGTSYLGIKAAEDLIQKIEVFYNSCIKNKNSQRGVFNINECKKLMLLPLQYCL